MCNTTHYSASIHQIAQTARQVGDEVNQLLMKLDTRNAVIMLMESHCNLAQYYFQTQFLHAARTQNAMTVSAEMVHADLFRNEMNRQSLQGRNFKTILQTVHDNSEYPMSACLVPAYVIGRTDMNFVCTDMDFTDHVANIKGDRRPRQYVVKQNNMTMDEYTFAQSREGMAMREQNTSGRIHALQDKEGLLITHICGIQHGADDENPDGLSLLDYLVRDKQVVSIHLCEDKRTDHRSDVLMHKQNKWTQGMKDNYVADFAVMLPQLVTRQNRQVCQQWDRIVTENKSPELILSRKTKQSYKQI